MEKRFQSSETVFSHNPEIKLSGGRLMAFRLIPGDDIAETEGLLLRRLRAYTINSSGTTIKGDFFRETSLSSLHTVHQKDAIPCRRSIKLPKGLQNEDILLNYLEEELKRSQEIPPFSLYEIFTAWAKHSLGWLSAIIIVPFALLYSLISHLFYAEAKGKLEGFRVIDGRHYPSYSFSLPDGTVLSQTEQDAALEDSVTEDEVARILRRKYPKPVTVQYKRKNPQESNCRYL